MRSPTDTVADAQIPVTCFAYNKETESHTARAPTRKSIKGPIPLDWISRANALPGKAGAVGCAVVSGGRAEVADGEADRRGGEDRWVRTEGGLCGAGGAGGGWVSRSGAAEGGAGDDIDTEGSVKAHCGRAFFLASRTSIYFFSIILLSGGIVCELNITFSLAIGKSVCSYKNVSKEANNG